MTKLSLAVVTLMIALSSVNIKGDDDLEAAWNYHMNDRFFLSTSPNEMTKRKANFAAVHSMIEAHNNDESSTFKMRHNEFSFMSSEEKRKFLKYQPSNETKTFTSRSTAYDKRCLPTTVDLRSSNCMQPVKNQGKTCSSSWAFAATAVVEYGHCMLKSQPVDLSEQQLVDCDTEYSRGCRSGGYGNAWRYLGSSSGQVIEASYPYTGSAGTCVAKNGVVGATVSNRYADVIWVGYKDITTMKWYLANNNLLGAVMAVKNNFYNYASGVYKDRNCNSGIQGFQSLVLVGYGTLNSTDYWIARNSWGPTWGMNGYALIQRGVNMCSVEGEIGTVVVTG